MGVSVTEKMIASKDVANPNLATEIVTEIFNHGNTFGIAFKVPNRRFAVMLNVLHARKLKAELDEFLSQMDKAISMIKGEQNGERA